MMKPIIDIILEALVINDNYRKTAIPHIKTEYFEEDYQKLLFETIQLYTEKYLHAPTREALSIDVESHPMATMDTLEAVETVLGSWGKEPIDEAWILDNTEAWCQDRAIYMALAASIEIANDDSAGVSRGKIPELMRDALSVSFDSSVGLDYNEDTEELYEFYHTKENKMPFDLAVLNKITDGGVPAKTLNLIMGGPATGKSMWLCSLAAGYMMQGKNVLYISMEMAEEQIAERIDANLLNMEIDAVKKMSRDNYMESINRAKSQSQGNLLIKQYPTGGAHVGHFRHLLNELKIKKNTKPDVIIIDYLNICMSSRLKMGGSINTYSLVKSIAEEVRGLAVEQGVPIWSATQSNRGAVGASDVDIDDVSESFGVVATVDFMMGLISTDELEEMGQQMVKILKNRYGSAHAIRKFLVNIDRPTMRVTESENDWRGNSDEDKVPITEYTKSESGKDFSGFKI